MSIQDESFPHDDDLEFSVNSGKNFVFPHHNPRRNTGLAKIEKDEDQHVVSTNHNTSSSPVQNHNDSTQSSNGVCPPLETSVKTNTSEPNDLQESDNRKSEFVRNTANKSISYQDIHSEYTKRRYKHVESKVGQYIANIKAQDEKRRNSGKFQRHRSLPETLHGTQSKAPELNRASKDSGILCHSTNDLHHMHDHNDLQSDRDDTENDDNLTSTTSSVSVRDLGQDAGIFLDKQAYEQLLSNKERNDYLQTKLEEKNAENVRLKQNLDTMRIEYTMCKDKLKQQKTQAQRFSGSFGSINAVTALGKNSLQCLLYPQETKEKSTQTDKMSILSPVPPLNNGEGKDMFITPLPTDSNNNSYDHAAMGMLAPVGLKLSKNIATIQPLSLNFSNLLEQDSREFNSSNINTTMGFLRHRSNSIATCKKSTPKPSSSGGSAVAHSSDSAIDIEVTESPRNQAQNHSEEFIYYDKRSQRYAVLETRNAGQSYTDADIITSLSNSTAEGGLTTDTKRNCRKRHNLRSRMMRFFRSCTKCKDQNLSLDHTIDNSQQQSYSQIPLLEKSS